jgi:hypothetical protein
MCDNTPPTLEPSFLSGTLAHLSGLRASVPPSAASFSVQLGTILEVCYARMLPDATSTNPKRDRQQALISLKLQLGLTDDEFLMELERIDTLAQPTMVRQNAIPSYPTPRSPWNHPMMQNSFGYAAGPGFHPNG